MTMLCTAKIDMANLVAASNKDTFLTHVALTICSTYHTVLKASPEAAIFGPDMLFDIVFLTDWNKIGDCSHCQTDVNTQHENKLRCDWDYQVDDKVLLWKDGILCKSESWYERDPWTITSVHTNGTIRVLRGTMGGDDALPKAGLF
jgi:hypothetical protein